MAEYNTFSYFLNLLAITFIFWPLYNITKNTHLKSFYIIIMGFICLWAVAPRILLFYFCYWLIVWLISKVIHRLKSNIIFLLSIITLLTPMIGWKLWTSEFLMLSNFIPHLIIWEFARPIGEIDLISEILIPIGLSFTTFRAIDLVVQVKAGLIEKPPTYINLNRYAFFPFVLAVGPICQYQEVNEGLNKNKIERIDLISALCNITSGLIKIFILAYPLSGSTSIFTYFEHQTIYIIWLETIKFSLFLFFNFAGFTDLAIGFSKLFGFSIRGNFNFPFLQTNIQNFWNNWHISLSSFAQRNVYVPCGGYRKNKQYIALFATMMVIALWHGLTLSFLCFGIYHGLALCLHRYFNQKSVSFKKFSDSIPTYAKVTLTFSTVVVSFPLVCLHDDAIIPFYSKFFGIDGFSY